MPGYRVLGQANPPAGILTDLYTASAGSAAVVSTVMVAELGGSATAFHIAVAPGGAAHDPKHFLACSAGILARDSVDFTCGITLAPADVVRVMGASETLAFNMFGEEIASP